MIGVIIFAAVCIITYLVIGVILIIGKDVNNDTRKLGILFIFLAGVFFFPLLLLIFPEPSAIDVYRGKTSLKITETVQDSIVIKRDSVVVWKKKIK